MEINFNKGSIPHDNDLFILFAQDNNHILLEWDGDKVGFPGLNNLQTTELSYIGSFLSQPVWCGYISELSNDNILLAENDAEEAVLPDSIAQGQKFLTKLRIGLRLLGDEHYELVCRAKMISYWRSRRKFCGACGSKLQLSDIEFAMTCSNCNEIYYPQIAPAIIVAIRRNDQILMVKSKRSLSGFYGLVAGYVEAGESLESAVCREVKEETNLEIRNIQYIKSQAWPFPNSQMMAFTADYAAGDLRIQKDELIDAQWFRADKIPPLPPRLSIGRFLVEEFIREAGL